MYFKLEKEKAKNDKNSFKTHFNIFVENQTVRKTRMYHAIAKIKKIVMVTVEVIAKL